VSRPPSQNLRPSGRRGCQTSVFVDAERRHGPAVERIADLLVRGELAVSAVTVFELTRGRTTPRPILAHYAELFGREATVLPVTHAAALLGAEAARAAGEIKAPDALIAGTALEHGVPVVTSDADFRRVPGLLLEWVPRAPTVHEPEADYRSTRREGAYRAGRREDVAARIRELREAAGMRAAEVAAAAGMARSNYARLESGRHEASLDTLRRVALAVGVPITGLLEPAAGRVALPDDGGRRGACPPPRSHSPIPVGRGLVPRRGCAGPRFRSAGACPPPWVHCVSATRQLSACRGRPPAQPGPGAPPVRGRRSCRNL